MSYPAAMQALLDQFANQDVISQKIVQVGSLQPFDLVRVHSNPTDLVLTNTHDRNVATTTVVLLTDGQARTGLKFKPDAAVINEHHDQTLNLIVASSINQTISIEFANYPAKEVQVLANQPVIVNIGVLYGIPLISSTASFFDVATGDNGGSSGFTFVNSEFAGESLRYTGGDMSILYTDKPAFAITTKVTNDRMYGFKQPNYDIDGINPFDTVALIISESDDPAQAHNDRNNGIGGDASDFTSNGANSGISINKPGNFYIYQKAGQGMTAWAKVVNDAISWQIYIANEGVSEEFVDARPGIHERTLYCHVVVTLRPEFAQLSLEQIEVRLSLHGMTLG